MGEIDRINPILRPTIAPRPADRVQPESDRDHHHPDERRDELELSNTGEHAEAEEASEPEADEPEHGLDLAI